MNVCKNVKSLSLFMMTLMLMILSANVLAAVDVHKIVFHIDENDAKKMNLVLNNASNVNKYYLDKGEEAEIEIVAYGPGLMMLREDKSPVKDRIKVIAQNYENVSFKACNNTYNKMLKKEKKKSIPLVSVAKKVPSGVIHLVQRQEDGWTYIRP